MDNTSGAAILDRQDQSTKNTKDGSTVARPNISPLSTSSKKVSNTSATGNPRNKCALQPGHSLMDWIRLGNSGEDLAGTGGQLRPVTRSELSKHNSRQDAWLAIRGMVYNITRYLDFHPGGKSSCACWLLQFGKLVFFYELGVFGSCRCRRDNARSRSGCDSTLHRGSCLGQLPAIASEVSNWSFEAA